MLAMVENTHPRPASREERRVQRIERFATGLPKCSSYDEFVGIMVARRHVLHLTQSDVDYLAGFADGHTSKLEQWQSRNGRVAGTKTMPRWIKALWSDDSALDDPNDRDYRRAP